MSKTTETRAAQVLLAAAQGQLPTLRPHEWTRLLAAGGADAQTLLPLIPAGQLAPVLVRGKLPWDVAGALRRRVLTTPGALREYSGPTPEGYRYDKDALRHRVDGDAIRADALPWLGDVAEDGSRVPVPLSIMRQALRDANPVFHHRLAAMTAVDWDASPEGRALENTLGARLEAVRRPGSSPDERAGFRRELAAARGALGTHHPGLYALATLRHAALPGDARMEAPSWPQPALVSPLAFEVWISEHPDFFRYHRVSAGLEPLLRALTPETTVALLRGSPYAGVARHIDTTLPGVREVLDGAGETGARPSPHVVGNRDLSAEDAARRAGDDPDALHILLTRTDLSTDQLWHAAVRLAQQVPASERLAQTLQRAILTLDSRGAVPTSPGSSHDHDLP